jgi:hypothetical protein
MTNKKNYKKTSKNERMPILKKEIKNLYNRKNKCDFRKINISRKLIRRKELEISWRNNLGIKLGLKEIRYW